MRTRSRNATVAVPLCNATYHCEGGNPVRTMVSPSTITYLHQEMSDVVGNRDGENPLVQITHGIVSAPVSFTNMFDNGYYLGLGFGWRVDPCYGYTVNGFVDGRVCAPTAIPSMTVPSMAGMYADALRLMKSEFNLSAQLLELGQLPGLLSSRLLDVDVFKRQTTPRNVRPTPEEYKAFKEQASKKKIKKRHVSKFIQDASSDYLNYSFGWVPTVGAIGQLADGLSQFARISEEIQKQKDDQKRYSVSTSSRSAVFSFADLTSPIDYDVRGRKGSITVKLKLKYRFTTPDLEHDFRLRMQYLAESVNLLQIASGIWEAAPWSWLSDYIINVGSMISSFEEKILDSCQPRLEVISNCIGITTKYECRHVLKVSQIPYGNMCATFSGSLPESLQTFTKYERIVGSDLSASDGSLTPLGVGSGLNLKKASYLLAIGLQKI